MELDHILQIMSGAARQAGAGLREDYARVERLTVNCKAGIGDLQSSADLRAEQTIKKILQAEFPGHSFLCEESGFEEGVLPNCWIIDPLDGTTNFLRRIPLFAVNLASQISDEIIAAVTYIPMNDELFCAAKGRGAYRNGERINVSGQCDLRAATVSVGIPFSEKKFHPEFHKEMTALTPNVTQVRRLGSGALELAYVACGRLDAYWERDVSPWDIAAGLLLVQEAGGHVSDADGMSASPAAGSIMASAPGLAAELLELLRSASGISLKKDQEPDSAGTDT